MRNQRCFLVLKWPLESAAPRVDQRGPPNPRAPTTTPPPASALPLLPRGPAPARARARPRLLLRTAAVAALVLLLVARRRGRTALVLVGGARRVDGGLPLAAERALRAERHPPLRDRTTITSVRSLDITIFGLYDRTALSSDRNSTFRIFYRHKSMISSNITSAILVRVSRPWVETRFQVT